MLTAFASGGRRRSEIANLVLSQIREEEPVPADPERPHAARLDCISLLLGRTKTEAAAEDIRVYSIGPPATELRLWIHNAPIKEGPVFRALGRWERLSDSPITPKAINDIIKQRCRLAGLDPLLYSAHGLRAGYLTESARKGVPLIEAMQQSRHKSVQQASRYYNDAERTMGGATRLVS